MSAIPQIINTPKILKFSTEFGTNFSGTKLAIRSDVLNNDTILNTSRQTQYYVQLLSANLSNKIYNVHISLGNNQIIVYQTIGSPITYTIPDGYYTIAEHKNGSNDIISTVNTLCAGVLTLTLANNGELTIDLNPAYYLVKLPPEFGVDYAGYLNTGPVFPPGFKAVTREYGYQNTINIAFYTDVELPVKSFPLSSTTPANPIMPVYAQYGVGTTLLARNDGNMANSPVNYTVYGAPTDGDFYAPGIVIGSSPIPYAFQSMPMQNYAGPIFTFGPGERIPLVALPPSVNYVSLTLCDDYGNKYYLEGHVEITVQITN
jgi:hypothetical protein